MVLGHQQLGPVIVIKAEHWYGAGGRSGDRQEGASCSLSAPIGTKPLRGWSAKGDTVEERPAPVLC